MNFRLLTSSAVLGGVLLFAAAQPADVTPETGAPVRQDDQDDETQLGLYMSDINRNLKALKTGLESDGPIPPARVVEIIGVVRELQVLFTKSRNETPVRVEEVAEDERAQWVLDFQLSMLGLSRQAIELESALLNGDFEAAGALRKEIAGAKRLGHRTYK